MHYGIHTIKSQCCLIIVEICKLFVVGSSFHIPTRYEQETWLLTVTDDHKLKKEDIFDDDNDAAASIHCHLKPEPIHTDAHAAHIALP